MRNKTTIPKHAARLLSLALFLSLGLFSLQAQTTLYLEEFSNAAYDDGTTSIGVSGPGGLATPCDGTVTDNGIFLNDPTTGDADATLSGAFSPVDECDYIKVRSGQLRGRDTNGNEACFNVNVDIQGYIATVNVDVGKTIGTMEADDYVEVNVTVDGGSTNSTQYVDDFTSTTHTVGGLIGNAVTVQVCIKNGDGTGGDGPGEVYFVDNVEVEGIPCLDLDNIALSIDDDISGLGTDVCGGGMVDIDITGINRTTTPDTAAVNGAYLISYQITAPGSGTTSTADIEAVTNGATTLTLSGLTAEGAYTVMITEISNISTGCTDTTSVSASFNYFSGIEVNIAAIEGTELCVGQSYTFQAQSATTISTASWTSTDGGATITPGTMINTVDYTPSAAGSDTLMVLVTDANGCSDSASLALTVNPALTVAIDSVSRDICIDGTLALSSSATGGAGPGTYSYQWEAFNGPFALSSNFFSDDEIANPTFDIPGGFEAFFDEGDQIILQLTVTDNASCDATTMPTITLTLREDPDAAINVASPMMACSDEMFAIDVDNPNTYGTLYRWTAMYNGATGGQYVATPIEEADFSADIEETLTNVTDATITVTYTITPIRILNPGPGSPAQVECVGTAITYDVMIKPEPVYTAVLDATICSGDSTGVVLPTEDDSTLAIDSFNIASVTVGASTGMGITDVNFIRGDVFTNTAMTDSIIIYTVTPFTMDCPGDDFTITITVNPEPVVADVAFTVCSDEAQVLGLSSTGGALDMINILSIDNDGLTASAGTPATGTVAPTAIDDDAYTNERDSSVNVVYRIIPISAAPCNGDTFTVTLTVDPEPVITINQDTTICSDDNVGVILNEGENIDATTYEVTMIDNPAGLTPAVGNTMVGDTGDSTLIAGDSFTNGTASAAVVTYTIEPVSTDGCVGTVFTVMVTINPEPVVTGVNTLVCSDSPLGDSFAGFTASNGLTVDSIVVNSRTIPGAPVVVVDTVQLDTFPGFDFLNDTYNNISTGGQFITYNITPFSNGCAGDPVDFTFQIVGEPVLATDLDATVCSDEASGIVFSLDASGFQTVTGYDVAEIIFDTDSLTAAGGNASTGANLAASAIQNDAYNNVTNNTQTAVYRVVPRRGGPGSGCLGDTVNVTLTVKPEPVQSNITASVCSDEMIGVQLPGMDDDGLTIDSFVVTAIADAMLVGSPTTSTGTTDASLISGDSFTNQTNATLTVLYTVTPYSMDCPGANFSIQVFINPEPLFTGNLDVTVCSGEDTGVILPSEDDNTLGIDSFDISASVNAMLMGIPTSGTGITDTNAIRQDTFLNRTNGNLDVIYTLTPYTADCVGDDFMITVTVKPEPYIAMNVQDTVCSDEAIGYMLPATDDDGLGIDSFMLSVSLEAGLSAVSNATLGSGITDLAVIALDSFNNVTDDTLTATYTITPYTMDCEGSPYNAIFEIAPEPVLANQMVMVCSDDSTNVVLPILDDTGLTVDSFVVTAVIDGGLTGTATTSTGTTDTTLIRGDVFNNVTTGDLDVTYTVTPFTGDCVGADFDIVVTIKPEPVLDNSSNPIVVCSDTALGDDAGFTGFSTTNGQTVDMIILNSVTFNSGDVTAGVGNAVVSAPNAVDTSYIDEDVYTYIGSGSRDITYNISPVTADGCVGDSTEIVFRIRGEAVIAAGQDVIICSGDSTGIDIQLDPMGQTNNVTFNVASVTPAAGLMADPGNIVAPVTLQASDVIEGDIWVNMTNDTLDVVYRVVPRRGGAGGCFGDTVDIKVTVQPAPELDVLVSNNGATPVTVPDGTSAAMPYMETICSDDSISLGFSTPLNTIAMGSNMWVEITVDDPTDILELAPGMNPMTYYFPAQALINGSPFTFIPNNVGSVDSMVTIRVVPFLTTNPNPMAIGPNECLNDSTFLKLTVKPEPVAVATPMATAQCDDGSFSIDLDTDGVSVAADSYRIGVSFDTDSLSQTSGTMDGATLAGPMASIVGVFNNTSNGSQTVTYTIVPETMGCFGDTITATVSIYARPITDPMGDDICIGDNETIFSNVTLPSGSSITDYDWTYIGGTATGFQIDNRPLFPPLMVGDTSEMVDLIVNTFGGVTTSGSASFQLTVTDDNGCESLFKVVTINFLDDNNAGTPLPGNTQFCENAGNINLLDLLDGEEPGGTITADPGNPAGGILSGTFFNPTGVPGTAILTFSFGYKVDNMVCPSDSSTITFDIKPLPFAGTYTGVQPVVCVGESYDLSTLLNNEDPGGSFTYIPTQSTGTGGAINMDSVTFSAITATPGLFTFEYRVSGENICADDVETVQLNVEAISMANAGPDTTICYDETLMLMGSFSGAATEAAYTGGAGTLTNLTDTTATYLPAQSEAGTVVELYYTATNPMGLGDCTTAIDTIEITVNDGIFSVDAGADTTICFDQTIQLDGEILLASGATTTGVWTTSGDGGFDDDTAANAVYTPGTNDIGTVVTLTYTADDPDGAGPCTGGQSDTVEITVEEKPDLSAEVIYAGNTTLIEAMSNNPLDVTLCSGDTISFELISNSIPLDGLLAIELNVTDTSDVLQSGIIGVSNFPYAFLSGTPFVYIAENVTAYPRAASLVATAYYDRNISGTLDGDDCAGMSISLNITIDPEPVGNDDSKTICSGDDVDYDLEANLTPGLASDFMWIATADNSDVSGESLTAQMGDTINDVLSNVSSTAQTVIYDVIPTSTPGGCVGDTFQITITVDPEPVGFDDMVTICSDDPLNYDLQANVDDTGNGGNAVNSNFSWVAVDNPAVTGESTTPQTGDMITDVLNNVSGGAATVVYTVTPTSDPEGCEGETFTVSVTIGSEPVFTMNLDATICSGDSTGVVLPTLDDNSLPIDSFTVAAVVDGGLTGVPTTGSGITDRNAIRGDVFTNVTNAPLLVTYTLTPYAGGCVGTDFDIVVTVKPEPVYTENLDDTICSGDVTGIVLAGVDDDGLTIDSFDVLAMVNPLLVGSATSDSGITDNNALAGDFFANTTGGALTVIYKIVPISMDCAGDTLMVTITVNPEPVGDDVTVDICSGDNVDYVLQENIDSLGNSVTSTFEWTAVDNPDVSGETLMSSAGTITDALTNTTNIVQTVIYTVTPTSDPEGCEGESFDITVNVSPEPVGYDDDVTICNDTAVDYDLQDNVDNVDNGGNAVASNFSWVAADNVNVTGESLTTQMGDTITDVLVNTGATVEMVVYTVTPVSEVGDCIGEDFSITVTVEPKPAIQLDVTHNMNTVMVTADAYPPSAPYELTVCSGETVMGSFMNLTAQSQGVLWVDVVLVDSDNQLGFGTSGNFQAPFSALGGGFSETLDNLDDIPDTIMVTMTPFYDQNSSGDIDIDECVGMPFKLTIYINPEPIGVDDAITICAEDMVGYDLQNNVDTAGNAVPSTFTWVAAANADVGGESTSPVTASTITDVLTNDTDVPQTVVYTVTPTSTAGGCQGDDFSITVTVEPKPTIDLAITLDGMAAPQLTPNTVCSGTIVSISASSMTTPSDAGHAMWAEVVISDPNSMIGGSQTVYGPITALDGLMDTLENTSFLQQTITATITPYIESMPTTGAMLDMGECTGDPITIVINVNPEPVGADDTVEICTSDPNTPMGIGLALQAYITNGVTSTFTWTGSSSDAMFLTGVSAMGSGTVINDTLTNLSPFLQTATYIVTPTSSDGCAGDPFTLTVEVKPSIQADIITNNGTILCSGGMLDFTGSGTGGAPPYTYDWSIIDSSGTAMGTLTVNPLSNDQVTLNATGDGTLTVQLIVSDANSCVSLAETEIFNVADGLASFSYTVASADGLTLDFMDETTGSTSWLWTFGDGDSSMLQNPSHTYNIPGDYEVCLTVDGPCGMNQACETVTVTFMPIALCDTIALNAGFNVISFDVAPTNDSVQVVFADIITNGTLVQITGINPNTGGTIFFNPNIPAAFNTLKTFQAGYGYIVRMTGAEQLITCGTALDPSLNVDLLSGFNIIGYIPQQPIPAADYFSTLVDSMFLINAQSVENGTTVFYNPNIPPAFNTLDDLMNGFGYILQLTNPVDAADWRDGFQTSSAHEFYYGYSNLENATIGEQVRIYTEDGTLRGVMNILPGGLLMTTPIYGDLSITEDVVEGVLAGDKLLFEYRGERIDPNITFSGDWKATEINLTFQVADPGTILDEASVEWKVYPNPMSFNGYVELTQSTAVQELELIIVNAYGQVVSSTIQRDLAAGQHQIELDVNRLPSGIYHLRLVRDGALEGFRELVITK